MAFSLRLVLFLGTLSLGISTKDTGLSRHERNIPRKLQNIFQDPVGNAPQQTNTCQLNGNGFYGTYVSGVAPATIKFVYQTIVPQGTDPDTVRDALDIGILEAILPFFFECTNRRLRQNNRKLQIPKGNIVGMSKGQPDFVTSTIPCAVSTTDLCLSFEGEIMALIVDISENEAMDLVMPAIKTVMDNGLLQQQFSFLNDIYVADRDGGGGFLTAVPVATIPPTPSPTDVVASTDSPTPSPTFPAPLTPSPTTRIQVTPSPTPAISLPPTFAQPTVQERSIEDNSGGFEWWYGVVIGVGALALCLCAFAFLRGSGQTGRKSFEEEDEEDADDDYVPPSKDVEDSYEPPAGLGTFNVTPEDEESEESEDEEDEVTIEEEETIEEESEEYVEEEEEGESYEEGASYVTEEYEDEGGVEGTPTSGTGSWGQQH